MAYEKPEIIVLSEEDVEEIAPNCSGYHSSTNPPQGGPGCGIVITPPNLPGPPGCPQLVVIPRPKK